MRGTHRWMCGRLYSMKKREKTRRLSCKIANCVFPEKPSVHMFVTLLVEMKFNFLYVSKQIHFVRMINKHMCASVYKYKYETRLERMVWVLLNNDFRSCYRCKQFQPIIHYFFFVASVRIELITTFEFVDESPLPCISEKIIIKEL